METSGIEYSSLKFLIDGSFVTTHNHKKPSFVNFVISHHKFFLYFFFFTHMLSHKNIKFKIIKICTEIGISESRKYFVCQYFQRLNFEDVSEQNISQIALEIGFYTTVF